MLIEKEEFKKIASQFCKDNMKSILEKVSNDLDTSEINDLINLKNWAIHGLFTKKEYSKEVSENYPNEICGYCAPFDDRFDISIKLQEEHLEPDEEYYGEKVVGKYEKFIVELKIDY